MIGIYIDETESNLLIPLLVNKIKVCYDFNEFDNLSAYQEILGRIYASLKIGCLNVENSLDLKFKNHA